MFRSSVVGSSLGFVQEILLAVQDLASLAFVDILTQVFPALALPVSQLGSVPCFALVLAEDSVPLRTEKTPPSVGRLALAFQDLAALA
jgi:hypothetical protein